MKSPKSAGAAGGQNERPARETAIAAKPGRRTSVADAGSSTRALFRARRIRSGNACRQGASAATKAALRLCRTRGRPHQGRETLSLRHPPPEKTEIGFKKPPKAHSWKKGQSGNPKGRKKGSRNKKTIIIRLMEGRLGRKIPDPKKLTAQEALLWKAIQKGLAGDARAMAFAFKRYDDATASGWAGPVITTEEDRQVYDALRTKIRREIEEENDASE